MLQARQQKLIMVSYRQEQLKVYSGGSTILTTDSNSRHIGAIIGRLIAGVLARSLLSSLFKLILLLSLHNLI